MLNFFKKIYFFIINFIPNKQVRHFLREKFNRYFCLDVVPLNAIRKRHTFLKNLDKYNTVAIGSSHCETSFNPEFTDTPSFNFGLSSCDNFMMYEIYRNIIKNTKTKNIIVFYDVFSRGSDTKKQRMFKDMFFPLKYILGINYEENNNRIKKMCKKVMDTFEENDEKFNGYVPIENPIVDMNNLEKRYSSHLKLWKRGGEDKWLIKLAQECTADNKNFIFVISPARKCYKNYMPDSKTLFEDMIEKLQTITSSYAGSKYNFYDTDIFEDDSLWLDTDHLNKKGAEVFTKKLNEQMKQDGLL